MIKNAETLSLYVRLIKALDEALSVEEIFDAVTELACQIIPANRSSVTTFHRDEKTLEARSINDDRSIPSSRLKLGFKFTLSGNPADYIELALKPKIWAPTEKSYGHSAQDLNELGMLSVMNVPLLSDQQFIGTLNLGSRSRIFQPNELTEFRQIAALVGISLDRFSDLTRVKATSKRYQLYAQQLGCLNDLCEQLLQVSTLEQVLEKTKYCVNQLVGARRVSYCSLEPDGQSIRIKALVGESTDHAGQLVPLEDSGLATTLINGKSLYIHDLPSSQNKAHRSLGRSGLSHLWAFPIIRDQRVIDALIIATEKTALASEEATAILGTLARLLEATLERIHAQTYAENIQHPAPRYRKTKLEQQLAVAVANEELSLLFQPVVNTENHRVIHVEALLRWHHPEHGLITPSRFIPLAESSNTMPPITDWVLESGLTVVSALQKVCPGLRVAINVAATELADPESLFRRVENALTRSNTNPALLELELTETTLFDQPDAAHVLIKNLKSLGTQVSLHNFGCCHASLSSLVDLPINTINIDRSFVNKININRRKQAVVKGLLTTAQTLGITCVARGVDTWEQLQWFQDAGCHYQQGNFISKPVDLLGLKSYLQQTSIYEAAPV